jgi:hypothetical protein
MTPDDGFIKHVYHNMFRLKSKPSSGVIVYRILNASFLYTMTPDDGFIKHVYHNIFFFGFESHFYLQAVVIH